MAALHVFPEVRCDNCRPVPGVWMNAVLPSELTCKAVTPAVPGIGAEGVQPFFGLLKYEVRTGPLPVIRFVRIQAATVPSLDSEIARPILELTSCGDPQVVPAWAGATAPATRAPAATPMNRRTLVRMAFLLPGRL
ncbi:MAG: hypothetical protein V9G10_17780 [Candidatus Nanopelagicales bacterium]